MNSSNQKIADLHKPEELLDNAEALYNSGNSKLMRAAVLEAITAFESFVYKKVFDALRQRFDPPFTKWLEERTKMDFESRLSVLIPLAIGSPINKSSELWNDYKRSKKIRNDITHLGKKVTLEEVRFVIDTVYTWLAYLGSTIELEVALLQLKAYVEDKEDKEKPVLIDNERDATSMIVNYFGKSKAATAFQELAMEHGSQTLRADAVLTFGSYIVVVETKFRVDPVDNSYIELVAEQAQRLIHFVKATQAAVVIFQKSELPLGFDKVLKHREGSVYIVVIGVKVDDSQES